jgi:hypothetical protein
MDGWRAGGVMRGRGGEGRQPKTKRTEERNVAEKRTNPRPDVIARPPFQQKIPRKF